MAKLKVLNVKKVESQIRQDIRKILRDKEVRDGVGKIVVDGIRDTNFADAGKATKAWRKYLEEKNPTHEKYSIEKINITFTGELLNDLIKNVKAAFTGSNSEYVIEHSEKLHKKYKKPNGKPTKGKAQKYKAIQKFIEKLGYEYMVFSDKSKDNVLEFIRKQIEKGLKRRK
jgi:hypothetical protein